MSYTALYRKFRPDTFEKVKGQDHIVTTLQNQIKATRIGHAYLFTGTRGTGKTTVAKLFAKAVNCENPVEGKPCNQCAMCKSIMAGTSMNVIEIDAASNNGVDNIRTIVDEVQYSPTEGKKKVYIIDEVHMLSTGAFNALLKTLEEPPEYVMFLLATTEVHKIPITILSRCQRYDFKHITVDTIADNLKDLCEQEGLETEEKALRYIAKKADGSMRDALSLLDQCSAFYIGQPLTYENVLEVLGAVDTDIFSKMLAYVHENRIIDSIHLLEEIVMNGRELSQFVTDFIWYMRNLLLLKSGGGAAQILDASEERMEEMRVESEKFDENTLMRYIRVFSELSNQIKFSSQKRVLVEIALIKLAKPAMEQDLSSIIHRIDQIERGLEQGAYRMASNGNGNQGEYTGAGNSAGAQNAGDMSEANRKELIAALPEEIKYIAEHFSEVYHKIPQPMKGYIRNAKIGTVDGSSLIITIPDSTGYQFLATVERQEALEKIIAEAVGKQVKVEVRSPQNQKEGQRVIPLSDKIHFKIEQEEE